MYLAAALARGAITAMQWMLNLNLYADNAATLDTAVRSVAAQVFWPLFAATMAIGAFSAYARMKREGGGSLFNDAAWLVAASILAGAFAIQPSSVMGELDDARTALAGAAMKGYASYGAGRGVRRRFPGGALPDDQAGRDPATRRRDVERVRRHPVVLRQLQLPGHLQGRRPRLPHRQRPLDRPDRVDGREQRRQQRRRERRRRTARRNSTRTATGSGGSPSAGSARRSSSSRSPSRWW